MAAAQLSVDGAKRRDPMRDYYLGSTYRKDALRGVLWDRLRVQLSGRPAMYAPLASDLAPRAVTTAGLTLASVPPQSAGATLSTILAYTLGVVRWEPLNPNAEHRPCPSPGSRFTVNATLSAANRDGVATYRYLPRDHVLIAVPARRGADIPSNSLEIALSCNVARCASPYGDLAYCLATIELGAHLAQLVLIASEFDLRLDDVRVAAGSAAGPNATPRLTALVDAPEIAAWLRESPSARIAVLDDRYPPFQVDDFPLLGAMLGALPTTEAGCEPWPDGFAARWPGDAPEPIFRATARRSSGFRLSGVSRANALPDGGRLTKWLDLVATLHASFVGLRRHGVRVDVLLPGDEPVERQGHRRLSDGSTLFIAAASGADRAWGYLAPPGATIVTLSAEYRYYVDAFAQSALFHMHLAAGVASQVIGLASAAMGFACRPMRSFDHAAVDATLPIDSWSVLQLVIWADEAINPAFPTSDFLGTPRP